MKLSLETSLNGNRIVLRDVFPLYKNYLKETYNAHFQVNNFILGYYTNQFTCFNNSHTV